MARAAIPPISPAAVARGTSRRGEAFFRRQDELLARLPDRAAEAELVKSLDGAVYRWAKRYGAAAGVDPAGFEDLLAEGRIGALNAIRKFDRSYKVHLLTYATWWIRQAIGRYIDEAGGIIRVPVGAREKQRKAKRARTELWKLLGRQPTIEELSGATGISQRALGRVLAPALEKPISIETPIAHDDGDALTIADRLVSDAPSAEEILLEDESNARIDELLTGLNEREQAILRARADGKTLEEIGEAIGSVQAKRRAVGGDRIRQIEVAALVKLRRRARLGAIAGSAPPTSTATATTTAAETSAPPVAATSTARAAPLASRPTSPATVPGAGSVDVIRPKERKMPEKKANPRAAVLAALQAEPERVFTLDELREIHGGTAGGCKMVLYALLKAGEIQRVGEGRTGQYRLAVGLAPAAPKKPAPTPAPRRSARPAAAPRAARADAAPPPARPARPGDLIPRATVEWALDGLERGVIDVEAVRRLLLNQVRVTF